MFTSSSARYGGETSPKEETLTRKESEACCSQLFRVSVALRFCFQVLNFLPKSAIPLHHAHIAARGGGCARVVARRCDTVSKQLLQQRCCAFRRPRDRVPLLLPVGLRAAAMPVVRHELHELANVRPNTLRGQLVQRLRHSPGDQGLNSIRLPVPVLGLPHRSPLRELREWVHGTRLHRPRAVPELPLQQRCRAFRQSG